MESPIAVFLWRQPACERLPTSSAAASLPTIWVGLLRPLVCCAFLPPRLAVSWLPLAPFLVATVGFLFASLVAFSAAVSRNSLAQAAGDKQQAAKQSNARGERQARAQTE